jgi:hypothetical protein
VIDQLTEAGFVEDGGAELPTGLTEREVSRRLRYRLYLAGMLWDSFVVCASARLRCGSLSRDGMAYVRHILSRMIRRATTDPTAALRARERPAVRIYTMAMVAGSVVALSVFAGYGPPILIEGVVRAISGLVDGFQAGDLLRTVDSALIIAVEGALQVPILAGMGRGGWCWAMVRLP